MTLTLNRVLGRLKRAQDSSTHGRSLKYDNELSSDDESPRHGHPLEVMAQLVQSSTLACGHLMGFLENNRWEPGCDLLKSFGGAVRAPEPALIDGEDDDNDDDDCMDGPGETENQRRIRYMNFGMGEVSDADFWADLHYGPSGSGEGGPETY